MFSPVLPTGTFYCKKKKKKKKKTNHKSDLTI